MKFLLKILESVFDTLAVSVGGGAVSTENFLIGILTLIIVIGIFIASCIILKKYTQMQKTWCIVSSIGITATFIFVFSAICLVFVP